jgi:hypothetical protein
MVLVDMMRSPSRNGREQHGNENNRARQITVENSLSGWPSKKKMLVGEQVAAAVERAMM